MLCVLFGGWLLLPPPPCMNAKPFVTAVKGPSSEGQSPPEYGLHVLGSDSLCHSYSQQAWTTRHPTPSLPWSRGKTLVCAPLLIHPVQLHPVQSWGPTVPRPGPNHITHNSFAQLPLSDKHMIKRNGSQDNYIH